MTRTTHTRHGSDYTVTFPEFPTFTSQPHAIKIIQQAGKQDVVELRFGTRDPYYHRALKTGVLVKITWKTELTSGSWYGYVYNGDETTHASIQRMFVLRAIGSSFPLKQSGNKVWKNKTASEIVQDICKTFKIKAVVDKTSLRFSQQSLAGLTYWEKVQELANRVGFVAQMYGTTLYFQRIDKLIDQFNSVIPVLSYSDGNVNVGMTYEAQTLDHFKAKVGDLNESVDHVNKQKIINGINPITGEIHSVASSPNLVGTNLRDASSQSLFSHVLTDVVAETKPAARELSEAMSHLARFSIHGEASGQGDPRIAPYRTVEIGGTGELTDGFWVVKSVEHNLYHDGKYVVDFTCMTDGLGKNKQGAFRRTEGSVVPIRNVAYEMATGGNQEPSTPTISSITPLIKETDGGFNQYSNRWVGR